MKISTLEEFLLYIVHTYKGALFQNCSCFFISALLQTLFQGDEFQLDCLIIEPGIL